MSRVLGNRTERGAGAEQAVAGPAVWRWSLAAVVALFLLPAQAAEKVVVHTSLGDLTIELYSEKSPATVANFLEYVHSGFYDGTIFHRVIPRFMIQGGGFSPELVRKPTGEPVVNESKNRVNNERWTVAMARTDDPDSATSQFFINLGMNFDLDYRMGKPGYTVFGEVVEGQHVAREISLVETHEVGGHENVPVEPVTIKSVELVE